MEKKNIYFTWISEIMLQQTQVKTVIPYFNRFIKNFPNNKTLSNSSLQKILYIWSGLGYYQRAHNLYKTSKIIKKKYNNHFPENFHELIKLPGIGKSTAGAILSFSKNFHFSILDGNIKRILLRQNNLSIEYKNKLEQKLWKIIDQLIPIHHTDKFNQAMMDLGAIICLYKNPKCNICPIQNTCEYFKNNKKNIIVSYKNKSKKKKIGLLFLIFKYKKYIYLTQQKYQKFWKKLFCFPMLSFTFSSNEWKIFKKIKSKNINNKISPFIHKFTHFSLHIIPFLIMLNKKKEIRTQKKINIWYNIEKPVKIGIPSPVKKIIQKIKDEK